MDFHFNLLAPIYNKVIAQRYPNQLIENCEFQPGKLVEVGGGTGRFASFFLDKVDEVEIVEPAKKMVEKIRKDFPLIKVHQAYAENLPFDDNSLEHIIISDTLHHWNDREQGLQEIYRVLKKGGCLGIEEIHPKTKLGRLIKWGERIAFMGSNFYTPEQLMEILEKIGFTICKQDWVHSPTYFIVAKKNQ